MSNRYTSSALNTNRHVRFRVQGNTGATAANLFLFLEGNEAQYPHYGRLTSTPTANQSLAQLRASLIRMALTAYAPLVGFSIAADSASNAAGALIVTFEQERIGAFYDNAHTVTPATAAHTVADITDTVGTGAMSAVKTKPGLNSLLQTLSTISYDGGVTGPFGALSATGAIVLPDGTTTSGAPALDGGVDGTHATGLAISFLD